MTVQKTTYITVAVQFVDGKPMLDLSDDGEPGLWGDTYLFDEETEEDEWTFDMDAQSAAYDHLLRMLGYGEPR